MWQIKKFTSGQLWLEMTKSLFLSLFPNKRIFTEKMLYEEGLENNSTGVIHFFFNGNFIVFYVLTVMLKAYSEFPSLLLFLLLRPWMSLFSVLSWLTENKTWIAFGRNWLFLQKILIIFCLTVSVVGTQSTCSPRVLKTNNHSLPTFFFVCGELRLSLLINIQAKIFSNHFTDFFNVRFIMQCMICQGANGLLCLLCHFWMS